VKKFATILALVLFLALESNYAQAVTNSWSYGFGFTYPRFVSSTLVAGNINYGFYGMVKRAFSEHVGVRAALKYSHLQTLWGPRLSNKGGTNLFGVDFDLIYNFVPCEKVEPYFLIGIGGYSASISGAPDYNSSYLDYQFNVGFGVEWKLNKKWTLVTELGSHTAAASKLDGAYGTNGGGLLGSYTDTYMNFDIGVNYYFKKGAPSKICQLYEGIRLENKPEPVDYERIENIVKKYIPREVVKQVVVGANKNAGQGRWILVGVNFDFNSAKLRSEAYPILFHALQTLLRNPEMNVEIQGYTDNLGSKKYNKKLSLRRAQAVKDYLVAHGVNPSRLTVKGFGEDMPIASNKTAEGRALNRRIEFKIIK